MLWQILTYYKTVKTIDQALRYALKLSEEK